MMKMENKDIFDRIMSLKLFSPLYPFYKKHKEVLMYLFFGAVTTAVSILSFALFERVGLDELVANILSWIISVFVAFVTNTLWVFEDTLKKNFVTKIFKFYTARVSTLIIEELLLFVFIKLLFFNSLAVKSVAQIVVIVLNYVISKLFVFKNK